MGTPQSLPKRPSLEQYSPWPTGVVFEFYFPHLLSNRHGSVLMRPGAFGQDEPVGRYLVHIPLPIPLRCGELTIRPRV